MQNSKESKKTILDFIPSDWFKKPQESSVLMSAYRTLLVTKDQFKYLTIHDYQNARVLILFGQLNYLDPSQIKYEINKDGVPTFTGSANIVATPESGWLVVLQPLKVDGVNQGEYKIKSRAGAISSIYSAVNGRNMAFNLYFENEISMPNGNPSATTDSVINPHSFPKPDVSKDQLDLIYKVGKLIEKSETSQKNKIEISLHWFNEGRKSKGLDEFIKYWIALESLGMPDTTNVRPLNQSISNAYNVSMQVVGDRFGIGKIQGLRSRIVHHGEDVPIHSDLSDYLQGLYIDILFDHLGTISQKRAEKVLEREGFNLDKLLHITN